MKRLKKKYKHLSTFDKDYYTKLNQHDMLILFWSFNRIKLTHSQPEIITLPPVYLSWDSFELFCFLANK